MSSPSTLVRLVRAARFCGVGFYLAAAAFTFLMGAPSAVLPRYVFVGYVFVAMLFAYFGTNVMLGLKLKATMWQVSSQFERGCRLVVPLAGAISIICWPREWPAPALLIVAFALYAFYERQLQRRLSTAPSHYRSKDWS